MAGYLEPQSWWFGSLRERIERKQAFGREPDRLMRQMLEGGHKQPGSEEH